MSWAVSPLLLDGRSAEGGRDVAFMLERALVDFYRPAWNTADWERENDFDLDDECDWDFTEDGDDH